MIVVTIEMWPKGDKERATVLARAEIANKVARTVASRGAAGDYEVRLYGGVYGRPDLLQRVWKRGTVEDFDRVRRGTWDLLYLALKTCLGKRN